MMTVEEAMANNQQIFFEHGPGLRYDYVAYIVEREPGKALLGGLGGLGLGQMWVDELERHKTYPGYDDAPLVE